MKWLRLVDDGRAPAPSRVAWILVASAAVAALVDCGLQESIASGGTGGASASGPSSGPGMPASASSGAGASSAGGGGAGATGGGKNAGGSGGASTGVMSTGSGGATPVDIVIEAEDASLLAPGMGGHGWTKQTDIPGYSGASFMQCGPGTGAACTDTTMLDVCAASMTYGVTIGAAATYWFQVRMYATSTSDDSIWYGIDGVVAMPEINAVQDSTWRWITGNSFSLAAGPHTITIWQRECGARVDALALTTTPTPPP